MFSTIRAGLAATYRQPLQLACLSKYIHTTVTMADMHSSGKSSPKVAVVLSGCGVYDGSEVHESSAALVHLSRRGAEISMFAPDTDQMHAINHTKGEPMEHNRNVLVESARIARGKIDALSNLNQSNFDAVIFPGGFGAAKNLHRSGVSELKVTNTMKYSLCTFAVDNTSMKVNSDVEKVIKDFHSNKKPIGLCCIAPVLAAKLIPGCELTVGHDSEEGGKWPYAGTAGAIEAMGAKHVPKDINEAHVDTKNKLVTSAAFMYDGAFHEIYDSVGQMVTGVLNMVKK